VRALRENVSAKEDSGVVGGVGLVKSGGGGEGLGSQKGEIGGNRYGNRKFGRYIGIYLGSKEEYAPSQEEGLSELHGLEEPISA